MFPTGPGPLLDAAPQPGLEGCRSEYPPTFFPGWLPHPGKLGNSICGCGGVGVELAPHPGYPCATKLSSERHVFNFSKPILHHTILPPSPSIAPSHRLRTRFAHDPTPCGVLEPNRCAKSEVVPCTGHTAVRVPKMGTKTEYFPHPHRRTHRSSFRRASHKDTYDEEQLDEWEEGGGAEMCCRVHWPQAQEGVFRGGI